MLERSHLIPHGIGGTGSNVERRSQSSLNRKQSALHLVETWVGQIASEGLLLLTTQAVTLHVIIDEKQRPIGRDAKEVPGRAVGVRLVVDHTAIDDVVPTEEKQSIVSVESAIRIAREELPALLPIPTYLLRRDPLLQTDDVRIRPLEDPESAWDTLLVRECHVGDIVRDDPQVPLLTQRAAVQREVSQYIAPAQQQ